MPLISISPLELFTICNGYTRRSLKESNIARGLRDVHRMPKCARKINLRKLEICSLIINALSLSLSWCVCEGWGYRFILKSSTRTWACLLDCLIRDLCGRFKECPKPLDNPSRKMKFWIIYDVPHSIIFILNTPSIFLLLSRNGHVEHMKFAKALLQWGRKNKSFMSANFIYVPAQALP